MDTTIAFLALILPLTLSPGPATIALAGQGMAMGIYRSLPFYFGLLVSTLLVTLLCGFGVAEIVLDNSSVYNILKYAGVVFILYLATKLIRAKPKISETKDLQYGFRDGFMISVLNPKLFAVITVIFGQFMQQSSDLIYIITGFTIIVAFSQAVWLIAGVSLNSFIQSTRALRIMTNAFGFSLIIVAIYLLLRS